VSNGGDDGWQLLDRVGGMIAVGGFVVDLVFRTLQINGVISLIPTRESLFVGGIVTAIMGVVFLIIGVSKFYTDKALRYRSPLWDFCIMAVLFALAGTCFATLAESHPAHHAKPTIAADCRIIDDWAEVAAPPIQSDRRPVSSLCLQSGHVTTRRAA
jgi:hypothetical protein